MKIIKKVSIVLIMIIVSLLFSSWAFAADPPPPTMTLAVDTGIPDDNITGNGQINVGNLEAGATWDYSTNSGANWDIGSGTSFELADGTYNTDMIQVRQTVSGSTSVPVTNADTIVIAKNQIDNGDFENGANGFTSGYVYYLYASTDPGTCHLEGTYAVVTTSYQVHSAWTTANDHTFGTSEGEYFVANGSADPSDVVWQSVTSITVEPNQPYRFEASIMSLIGASEISEHYPNVKFQLGDGTNWVDLGTTDVDWVANEAGIWHLIYADGKFSQAGTYYIRLLNNQTSGYNDLGVDDIYFGLRGAAPSASDPATDPTEDPPEFDTSTMVSLALATDTGLSANDNITSNGEVNVTGLQNAWQYSTNSGGDWTNGTGSSFTLTGDGSKSVIVRQRNGSDTDWLDASAPLAFILDTAPSTVIITSGETSPTNAVPIPVTITFNENVTGFQIGDITVGNGSAGSLNGSGDTYTADITPTADGTITINFAGDAVQDIAGNGNTAATQFNIDSDTQAPTNASISINGADQYTNSTSATLTLGATEASEMIISEDSGFAGASYESYSASKSFTLSSGDGTKTVYVKYKDTAGNEISVNDTIELDTAVPTVTIASSKTSPTNAVPIPVTITFNEDVTGFQVGDITVGNGSAGSLNGSGDTYTADITPTADGTITINFAGDAVQDVAGNGNTAATQFSIISDTQAPTNASISINGADQYTNSTSAALTLAATEASEMIISEDSSFAGASYEAYSASKSFALSSGDGTKTVYVKYKDIAGNETSVNDTIELDTAVPTVTIASSKTSPTNAVPIPVTITFSEAVSGFLAGDVTAGNASAGDFSGSGSVYTMNVTPASDGTITVDITGNAAQDAAGNGSAAAARLSIVSDTQAPANASISINSGAEYTNGTTVILTLAATGASEMMISEDSSFSGASYIVYSASKSFTLSSEKGTKTVYARFKDAAGNETAAVNDTIELGTPASEDNTTSETVEVATESQEAENEEILPIEEENEPESSSEAIEQNDNMPRLGTISGRIVDINNNPMAEVLIELHSQPRQTYTDEQGYFEFENVELGKHTIYIIDERFEAVSSTKVELKVNDDDSVLQDFTQNLAKDGVPIELEDTGQLEIYFIVQKAVAAKGALFDWKWILIIAVVVLIVLFFILWKIKRNSLKNTTQTERYDVDE